MEFKKHAVIISTNERYINDRPVIQLISKKSGEPYLVATVNIPEIELESDEVLIKDYSENEGVLDFLEQNKIVEFTGNYIHQGWVDLPICKLLIKV
jgi:hypothetical protein